MNIEKRLAEIRARKAEIRSIIEKDDKADMDALEKELRELNEEAEGLERRQNIERMLNSGAAVANPVSVNAPESRSSEEVDEKLYRSAWLKTLQGKPLTDAEQRAYSTAASSGLPIIPETTANQIIKKMYEVAPILQRCRIFHVPGNMKFAVEGVNDDATLHTENAAITAAGDTLTSVNLTGYEIVKLVKASRACSEMALSAFESYVVEIIAEAVARKIENYIFTGTGSIGFPSAVLIANTWNKEIAHDFGATVVIDGAQAAPHMPVDLKRIDADVYCMSIHKMLGPSGMGVMYGKREVLERMRPLALGGGTVGLATYESVNLAPIPDKFEAGLHDYAGIVGTKAALDYLSGVGMEEVMRWDQTLMERILTNLEDVRNLHVVGPRDAPSRGGVFSFNIDGLGAHDIAMMLDSMAGVMIRSGMHCAHPFYVSRGIDGSARASTYIYNTPEEIDVFTDTVRHIAETFGD